MFQKCQKCNQKSCKYFGKDSNDDDYESTIMQGCGVICQYAQSDNANVLMFGR